MDKNLFKVTSLHAKDAGNFWKDKSYLERLEALEQLRMAIFNYDPATARLQRTITITQLKKN